MEKHCGALFLKTKHFYDNQDFLYWHSLNTMDFWTLHLDLLLPQSLINLTPWPRDKVWNKWHTVMNENSVLAIKFLLWGYIYIYQESKLTKYPWRYINFGSFWERNVLQYCKCTFESIVVFVVAKKISKIKFDIERNFAQSAPVKGKKTMNISSYRMLISSYFPSAF